jgi:hypothetical protein
MDKPKNIEVVGDSDDIFVVVDGVKIAKRGHPGTPEAGTWVSLRPGWTVTSNESEIEISHDGTPIH